MNTAALLLDRAASRFAERPALEDAWECVSYRELRERSLRLATALLKLKLRRGEPVALLLPKSIAGVVCYWGALYCGSPYAPLDYGMPDERLTGTLNNLQPGCVITDDAGMERVTSLLPGTRCANFESLLKTLPEEDMVAAARDAVIDSDPAYIMHTSGSTGVPKGVVIAHRSILDYSLWIEKTFSVTEETVFGMQSGFHFDNSVFDLYAAARCGARVQIIPEALFMYPVKLLEYLQEKKVTCIYWVPTVMISVANSGALDQVALPDLRTIVFAGEVMPNRQLNVWRRALPDRVFANMYGPTEITVTCTCYIVDRPFDDDENLPIGYERGNMRLLVLRDDGTEAAPGETGELCVLGSALSLGYWNAPEETARVFVPNPLSVRWGERMYRTGDLVSRDEDGLLHFVGRKDSQIKLRGNRIELGEIEIAGRALDGVRNVCALFDAEEQQIVLFLETNQNLNARKTRVAMGKKLPKYMLPGRVICMEHFPLNANRKIDRVLLKRIMKEEQK